MGCHCLLCTYLPRCLQMRTQAAKCVPSAPLCPPKMPRELGKRSAVPQVRCIFSCLLTSAPALPSAGAAPCLASLANFSWLFQVPLKYYFFCDTFPNFSSTRNPCKGTSPPGLSCPVRSFARALPALFFCVRFPRSTSGPSLGR